MIKEIKYNGYSASPSDYQSPDGDMACMLNCIPERGALKPILPPEKVEDFGTMTVKAIHRTSIQENLIILSGTNLLWRSRADIGSPVENKLHDFVSGVHSVTPIGNSLAVLDSAGIIHYFLWKDSAYKYLGTQLPELKAKPYIASEIFDGTEMDLRFGIEFSEENPSTSLASDDDKDGLLNYDETKKLFDAQTTSLALYGDVRQNVYNRVFATLNQFDRILKQKGYFTSPFFVRFAYRLFDTTHAMHTVPVLLVPTTWGAPLTSVRVLEGGGVNFDPMFSASQLTADIELPEDFADWSDIITHIDVYVTPQAISYTDSAESLVSVSQLPFAKYETTVNTDGDTVSKWLINDNDAPMIMDNDNKWRSILSSFLNNNDSDYKLLYSSRLKAQGRPSELTKVPVTDAAWPVYMAVDKSSGSPTITDSNAIIKSPMSSPPKLPLPLGGIYDIYKFTVAESIYSDTNTIARFYISKSSPSAFTKDPHHYIELRRTDGKDYRDVLTDYNTFYKVSEIDLKLNPGGFTGTVPLKKDVLVNLVTHETLPDTGQARSHNVVSNAFAYNNRLNIVVEEETLPSCADLLVQNPAVFIKKTISPQYHSAYVKVMENSQVAYHKLPDAVFPDSDLTYFSYPRATATELILCADGILHTIPLQRHPFLNLVYAFNMFNPIEGELKEVAALPVYPLVNIRYGNKIKTSDVNNPFIFSEENTSELPVGEIYALSTAAKALSQGQFGQFPLYAFTDKGVWALEVTGTGTYSARQPITRDVVEPPESVTQIDDAVLFATERGIMLLSGSQVQCISEVLDGKAFDWEQYGFAYKKTGELGLPTFVIPWEQYKANIQMLYDYTGQRIIVFNPGYGHAYVFSLESKQWGIMKSNIQSTVDYYPEAYAMTSDGDLVDYSAADGDFAEGYYITRPLKLDAPDVHKTITGIIQRGQFKKGHVNTMLYGSRDLDKWYPVYGSADHILRGMRGTPYKYFRIASTFHLERDESITGCSIDYEPRLNNKLR